MVHSPLNEAAVRQAQDLVRTPLGVTATVLGVRYASCPCPNHRNALSLIHDHLCKYFRIHLARFDDTNDASSARLWVKYQSGLEAPLEPRVSVGQLTALGYVPIDQLQQAAPVLPESCSELKGSAGKMQLQHMHTV